VSYNARRIIALAVVLLTSTLGGLLTVAFFDSWVAPVVGLVVGAVVGLVMVVIWASRSL
jgi:tetrahydromethanopterin S-methyltransferase subunit C